MVAGPKAFLGFPCVQCSHALRVFIIPANIPTPRMISPRKVDLECVTCGHKDTYETRALVRYDPDEPLDENN
jgi:hypothetical protein